VIAPVKIIIFLGLGKSRNQTNKQGDDLFCMAIVWVYLQGSFFS